MPAVGSVVTDTPKIAEAFAYKEEIPVNKLPESPFAVENQNVLSIVLCADSAGSLEAIINAVPKGNLQFVIQKTGDVDVSDILFAKSTGSIVLSFNVKIKPEIAKLAKTEKVLVKNYTIIYEMIDEVSDFVQGKLESLQEEIMGIAKILASFPYEKTKVMGIKVSEGRIAKGDKIRLLRDEAVIGETRVSSVRQGKEQASKIEAGQEGGVIVSPFLDFAIDDVLISHS